MEKRRRKYNTVPHSTSQDISSNYTQNQPGKWIKNVHGLLKSDSLSDAVKYWSQSSKHKPYRQKGISNSGDAPCTKTATYAISPVSVGNGENSELLDMQKSVNADSNEPTAIEAYTRIIKNPYWTKLCKRIRKYEKSFAERLKPNPLQTSSSSHITQAKKSARSVSVQQTIVEPKLKSILHDSNQKTILLKPKVPPSPDEPLCTDEKDEISTSREITYIKDQSKTNVYEIESVRMLSTQSTQTQESKSSTNSGQRDRRLKFRARIRVLPSKKNINSKKLQRKESQSIMSGSTRSVSTTSSKKLRASISCSMLSRQSPPNQRSTENSPPASRGQATVSKWSTKPKSRCESRDVAQRPSKKSITSQNSRSASIARRTRPTSRASKSESKSKAKLSAPHLSLKSSPSTETISRNRGVHSVKIRSARFRPTYSAPKTRILSSRNRSKLHRGEVSSSKRRNSQGKQLSGGSQKKGQSKKTHRTASALKIRKHMLRVARVYCNPSPEAPPPTPIEKSDSEIGYVKMKVHNMLECHRKFVEWQCDKVSKTCKNLLARAKHGEACESEGTEIEVFDAGAAENERFTINEGKSKIKEIVRKYLSFNGKEYIDGEANIDRPVENNLTSELFENSQRMIKEEVERPESHFPSVLPPEPPPQENISNNPLEHNLKPSSNSAKTFFIDILSNKGAKEMYAEMGSQRACSVCHTASIDLSASEIWTTETPKLSDDETASVVETISEHLGSTTPNPIVSLPKPASGCSTSQSSDVLFMKKTAADTFTEENDDNKSSGSYSDLISCSSGEIPMEKLKSAELFLKRFLKKFPKTQSHVAEKGGKTKTETRPRQSSERRSQRSPAPRRMSPSPLRRPPMYPHHRAYTPSGASRAHTPHRPHTRMDSKFSPTRSRVGHSSERHTRAIQNRTNYSTNSDRRRRSTRTPSRPREDSSSTRTRPERSRERSTRHRSSRRNSSAYSSDRRKSYKDMTSVRAVERSRERETALQMRRPDGRHNQDSAPRTVTRMPSSPVNTGRAAYVPGSGMAGHASRFHFRQNARPFSPESQSDRDRNFRTRSPQQSPPSCLLNNWPQYQMTKRWKPYTDFMKTGVQKSYYGRPPYDLYSHSRYFRSRHSPESKYGPPSKPWDFWQGPRDTRPDSRRISRAEQKVKEWRNLNGDYFTGSSSAERMATPLQYRSRSVYR